MSDKFFCYLLGVVLLISCNEDDGKEGGWNKIDNLLDVYSVSMKEGVTFKIGETVFVGLGGLGNDGEGVCYFVCYQPGQGWKKIDDFPGAARRGAVAFVLGENAYVGLGYNKKNGKDIFYDDFWIFNGKKMKWEEESLKFEFPGVPRKSAFAFCIGNKAYVGGGDAGMLYTGGGDAGNPSFKDVYSFEQEKGWMNFMSLPLGITGGIAFVVNGTAYVCTGGYYLDPSLYSENYSLFVGLFKLSNEDQKWIAMTPIDGLQGTIDGRRIFASSFVLKECAYIVGGVTGKGEGISSCYRFNPSTGHWSEMMPLPTTIERGVAFTIEEKAYLVGSGRDGTSGSAWEFVL